MDLRSGTPLWRAIGDQIRRFPALDGDTSCEVAVIGGGVTGAMVSHYLIDAGVDTVTVDRGQIATGSTAASTGLLQYEIDTPLVDLVTKFGVAAAVRAYRLGLEAIDELEEIVGQLGDRCGFSRRSTLCFASRPWHLKRLRAEAECRKQHGFDVDLLTRSDLARITSIAASGALYSRGDAQIDPYQLTQRLLERAHKNGLRIFEGTDMEQIDHRADRVALHTKSGIIEARCVVFATGYEAHNYLSDDLGSLHCTYAVASDGIVQFTGWPEGCLIWETARPYFYARQTDDGRALVGGADSAFSDDHSSPKMLEKKCHELQLRFEKLFPDIEFIPAYVWAGTFGESKDGLAYVGMREGNSREYFALGYGGNGITFSLIAARLITDRYLGKPNPDAAIFRFGR